MTRREELRPEIVRLRDVEGLKLREIGARLGISTSWVSEIYHDPTGARVQERKDRNNGVCRDCGGKTRNSGSTARVPERCWKCAPVHTKRLTRQWVLDSLLEWHKLFGRPPAASDWNPALAKYNVERRRKRLAATGRPWPAATSVIHHFGSWNAGLRAVGFEPLPKNEYWIGREGVQLREQDLAA